MNSGKDFKMLSFEGTVKVGLSFLGVVFIIVMLSSVLLMMGSALQTTEYSCLTGEPLRQADLDNGISDCAGSEDEESRYDIEREQNFVSILFTGLGATLMIAGFFGLFTKMVADAISAGLFLHNQNNATTPSTQRKFSSDSSVKPTPTQNELVHRICPECTSKIGIRSSSLNNFIRCPKCTSVFKFGELLEPSAPAEGESSDPSGPAPSIQPNDHVDLENEHYSPSQLDQDVETDGALEGHSS